eukprot:gene28291-1637_t
MAVNKFGLAEVQQWNFEVWNELWGMAGGDHTPPCTSQPCIGSTYMQLYNASAVGVKAVHPSLKIGGPATEHINTQNFLSQAKAMNTPVDFVSSHNYPTGNRGDGSGCPQGPTMWTPDCFYDRVTAARGKIPADIPFFITEYSVMVGEGMAVQAEKDVFRYRHNCYGVLKNKEARQHQHQQSGDGGLLGQEPPYQHDDGGAAAFVLRVVPQLARHLDVLSYWTFS